MAKKKSCEAVGDYVAAFNPIPSSLIVLIATAVECDILCWQGGSYSPIDFADHKFSVVYKRHIKNLEKYEKKQPAHYLQFRRNLWADAWSVSHL